MNEFGNWIISQDWLAWIGAGTGLLAAIYTICLLIPGDQPDKTIAWLLEITKKISIKK